MIENDIKQDDIQNGVGSNDDIWKFTCWKTTFLPELPGLVSPGLLLLPLLHPRVEQSLKQRSVQPRPAAPEIYVPSIFIKYNNGEHFQFLD